LGYHLVTEKSGCGVSVMAFVSIDQPGRLARTPRPSFIRRGRTGHIRHLLSARTIDSDDVDELCQAAEAYEFGIASAPASPGKTVALLFFQPSTRTRLGFEAATVALGAHPIGMEDMSASRSNARTGESLEDCAAVVSRLCDALVVRHHEKGAADRMAAKSEKPVINAGDGWNEHPTQALIDIFALRRGLGTISGSCIAFGGDPRGRTVRSLIQLLRFEAPKEIVFCPPQHYEVPPDILSAVFENQIRCRIIGDIEYALTECDAIMMAPYDMSDIGEPAASGYVSPNTTPDSHVITPEKIERVDSRTLIYHPLPRHDEIHPSCDDLPNAMYFEQVRLSKFMRMAVLNRMLSTN
jgi:aspartate carbamoyltransferase catalytic subunit